MNQMFVEEPARKLPATEVDVVVAGGGTAGVVAAIAAARQGASTVLIESKGYPGGLVVEGGTALHSYFNVWKPFPGVEKRQVVRGIAQEIIDRLAEKGGTSGHVEVAQGADYDGICTCVDTEITKLVLFEMLREAGVRVCVNTLVAGAVMEGGAIKAVIAESRSGREAFVAKAYVDCTGYGDLSAFAGAEFTEPNDHAVANSAGVAGVDLEGLHRYLVECGALQELAYGERSGKPNQIIRLNARMSKLPEAFRTEAARIGLSLQLTTLHDGYIMFLKLNLMPDASPVSRDEAAKLELALRQRQADAIALLRREIPGCEHAFIARTSPTVSIRRGRRIVCDYDITLEDVTEGRHFADDIMAYGFHDMAPRYHIKNGGTYGVPYRALLPTGVENLFVAGMLITSDFRAHMSTRNTVCCMGQGQAVGTAAALCAKQGVGTRQLPYAALRQALERDGVYFE